MKSLDVIERTDLSKYAPWQHLDIVLERCSMDGAIEALLIIGKTKKNIVLKENNKRERDIETDVDRERG